MRKDARKRAKLQKALAETNVEFEYHGYADAVKQLNHTINKKWFFEHRKDKLHVVDFVLFDSFTLMLSHPSMFSKLVLNSWGILYETVFASYLQVQKCIHGDGGVTHASLNYHSVTRHPASADRHSLSDTHMNLTIHVFMYISLTFQRKLTLRSSIAQ